MGNADLSTYLRSYFEVHYVRNPRFTHTERGRERGEGREIQRDYSVRTFSKAVPSMSEAQEGGRMSLSRQTLPRTPESRYTEPGSFHL